MRNSSSALKLELIIRTVLGFFFNFGSEILQGKMAHEVHEFEELRI